MQERRQKARMKRIAAAKKKQPEKEKESKPDEEAVNVNPDEDFGPEDDLPLAALKKKGQRI